MRGFKLFWVKLAPKAPNLLVLVPGTKLGCTLWAGIRVGESDGGGRSAMEGRVGTGGGGGGGGWTPTPPISTPLLPPIKGGGLKKRFLN
jgi:hypothetical protein